MGNDLQKQQQSGAIAAKVNHPKFQNAKVISEGKQKWLQTTMGIDQKQFQKWKNSLKPLNLTSTYLLLPKKQQFDRKGLCGDSGAVKLYYQNYVYLLTDEIARRNERKTIFEQTELWYLLLVLSSAQQQIKRKTKGKVGDIRPQNVFLNSQGEAKVSCTLSWPRQSTNFSKTFDNQRTYLSPEDIVRLEMGAMQDTHSFQSQIFSIGLTLLSAGMLEDFLKLYNIKTNSYHFNTEEATQLINQWKSNTVYSQILTAVISNLCQFKPQKRLDDDQLWRWLTPFQKQIKTKQDFFIQSAPHKIQQEIQEIRQMFPDEQHIHPYQQPPVQSYVQPPVHRIEPYQQSHQFFPQQLTDKSVVQHYNPPPVFYRPELNHPPREAINPTYVDSYHQPIPKQIIQRSSSNQRLVKEEFVPALNVQSPRTRNSENIAVNLPPQYRQTVNPYRQPTTFVQDYSIGNNGRFTTPTFIQVNPQQNQFNQRRVAYNDPRLSNDPRLANFLSSNTASNEKQLPPQFVGRTINETYITKGGETKTYQQGYIPQQISSPREQFMPIGMAENGLSRQSHQGLSYFQNVVDPQGKRGGRIEQTVYIQRPEYNFDGGRQ